jgi:sporulation integral membrane protein YlbJ
MNPNISFIFVMSLLSGSPSNAKYTSSLYQKKLLTKQEAEKALAFTYFSNPLFILGTVATSFLKNKNIGLTILISHILAEIILIFLFYHDQNQKYEKINLKKALNEMKQLGYQNSFSSSMIESITDSLKTCTLILGTIVFIYILTSSFSSFMPNNIYLSSTIKGILEVTQGLKAVSLLNIPLIYKATLSTFLLSFGGISIYIQIISILKDTDLNANYYIIIRCLHAAFSSLICYTILSI